MDMIKATRYHDFSAGHRVVGHESKCQHLHGHNYRVHFEIAQDSEELDNLGRVMDFGAIKTHLCEWIEENWDHKFLLYINDPLWKGLVDLVPSDIVLLKFNPTAENIAKHLVEVVGPEQLKGTGCRLIKCIVEETRKCSASYEISS
jgi:6-pyruvoyltetrahydropterin/6-carboxytetrahydropterin synthase